MTRQTSEPLQELRLNVMHYSVRELARRITEGTMDLDPPYQRGPAWTLDQRIALVRSWMLNIPVRAEAEVYMLLNGGGTPQTEADMARAARIAGDL